MSEGRSAENDAGPKGGHTFRFRFDIRGSSRVVGDLEYTDAPDFMGPVHEVQIRAWNLREALRKAADLPFAALMGNEVSDDAPATDPRHSARTERPMIDSTGWRYLALLLLAAVVGCLVTR